MAGPELLHEVEAAVLGLQLTMQARGCPMPTLIAYGHYPLSTVASIGRWHRPACSEQSRVADTCNGSTRDPLSPGGFGPWQDGLLTKLLNR